MTEENMLAKTNRMNLLIDFYELLLTEKQQMFVKLYFHDDYSLGEISAEYQISRQAVYEHIKRAELMLEEYESKLQLLSKHEQRKVYIQQLEALMFMWHSETKEQARAVLEQLSGIE
ncbi:putative DNA-binding protein [Paenibacillus sp. FSL H8-0034]|uniref:putative DNA-binding protein n=1 Tax=Paenibacillus sp. FSL H8-0034 TaxID=2954671 RepID=UPI0030F50C0A